MSWQDIVNGSYEALGGMALWVNVRALARDKAIAGVRVLPTAFFASWGVWNLYYYPHLSQWVSFAGGLNIVCANATWLALMVYYGVARR